jgi:hypothetical protein
MKKGISRGLLVGLVLFVLDALYVWLRYKPDGTEHWLILTSNSAFQLGLIVSMIGVVIFSRLFSYRRRMGLKRVPMFEKFGSKEEYKAHLEEQEKMNEKDEESLEERGRDMTLLVSAVFLLVVSILMTINWA